MYTDPTRDFLRARRAYEWGRACTSLRRASYVGIIGCLVTGLSALAGCRSPWSPGSLRTGAELRVAFFKLAGGAVTYALPLTLLRPCCSAEAIAAGQSCCTMPSACLGAGAVLGFALARVRPRRPGALEDGLGNCVRRRICRDPGEPEHRPDRVRGVLVKRIDGALHRAFELASKEERLRLGRLHERIVGDLDQYEPRVPPSRGTDLVRDDGVEPWQTGLPRLELARTSSGRSGRHRERRKPASATRPRATHAGGTLHRASGTPSGRRPKGAPSARRARPLALRPSCERYFAAC